jgi:hypothetical protein
LDAAEDDDDDGAGFGAGGAAATPLALPLTRAASPGPAAGEAPGVAAIAPATGRRKEPQDRRGAIDTQRCSQLPLTALALSYGHHGAYRRSQVRDDIARE